MLVRGIFHPTLFSKSSDLPLFIMHKYSSVFEKCRVKIWIRVPIRMLKISSGLFNRCKYRIFSNLIRTSFCRFLKRKKKFAVLICPFPSTAPCAQLLQKSRVGCRLHGKPSRRALSSDREHYRQIFQEVLHNQCVGWIRR